jgi:predicted RNA-binding protein with TRAM domain
VKGDTCVNIVSSVIAGNRSYNSPGGSNEDFYLYAGGLCESGPYATHSLIGNPDQIFIGSDNLAPNTAPMLGSGDTVNGQVVHVPLEGSPLIDAGVAAPGTYAPYDQRGAGYPRQVGAGVDIGAVEFGSDGLGEALIPAFATPTATLDGFTVQISNYDAAYEWAAMSKEGSVAIDEDLVTVSGLTSGQSATVTVTTNRTDYAEGSADVTASAITLNAALNPTFGAPTSNADGFTVRISNYDTAYEWAATSTNGTVAIDGDLVTVSGLTSGQSATVTVTTTRTSYAGGSADVTGSATVTEQTVGPVTLRITPLTSPSSCGIDELLVDSDFLSSADGVAINGLGVGVAFTLTGCSTDTLETVTVSIDFGSAPPEGSVAMKIDNDGNWSPIDGATIEGSMVTYTLTDNDEVLDQDPNAGTMTDPVTVAVPFTAPVVPVPTLPGLLLGLLSSLLGLAGLRRMRQQHKQRR